MTRKNQSFLKKISIFFLLTTTLYSLSSFKSMNNFAMISTSLVYDEVLSSVTPFTFDPVVESSFYEEKIEIFDSLNLEEKGLEFEAFRQAVIGMEVLVNEGTIARPEIITIADFSKPSSEKRLFVIDLNNYEILFNTYVSHGRNSGKVLPTKFSNKPSSYQSSLGFYKTAETYNGKHGYSLRLDGLEKGINDNARNRAIVIHGANYVAEKTIGQNGYIGRSQGCPAVSTTLSKPLINQIKDGSLLFIYSPDKNYIANSEILN
ncbi:MAG: murein L,D-transpeptidase catalytic domain family protein [Flavitalea sp.]